MRRITLPSRAAVPPFPQSFRRPSISPRATGALGATARYWVAGGAARWLGLAFPWGTLIVNVSGGLAMGVLAARFGPDQDSVRLALGVGVLGGFTTFSAFSLETVRLMEHQPGLAALYAAASVILSVGACWAGLMLGRL